MPTTPAILWFRRDLRLADNPTLLAALETGRAAIPVFVVGDPSMGTNVNAGYGAGSREWLALSLAELDASLRSLGSRLVIRRGDPADALVRLARETGARMVFCVEGYDPPTQATERRVRAALAENGVKLVTRPTSRLAVPREAVRNSQGGPYRVFSPYFRAWRTMLARPRPLDAPERIEAPATFPASEPLPDAAPYAPDVTRYWSPGERGAAEKLAAFVGRAPTYATLHDTLDAEGTSMLSPHLAWGEITARQVLWALDDAEDFVRQLGWREFAYATFCSFPDLESAPLKPEFSQMPWVDDPEALETWKAGMTGVPIVDAGMRQLAATGWMHGRARMIVASWLTKDLLLPWQDGESHFASLLADADAALNAFNWQWVAGSGADAAPYFRVFNPVVQSARFDTTGRYVRTWVPELARLDTHWLHRPWEAPEEILKAAGVKLGVTYPRPQIDHAIARERALAAYHSLTRR